MHNIRTRTLAATALLMLLAVATGVLGLSGAASLHGSFDELGQRSVPAQLLLLNIDRDAYQAQLALEQALFAPDAETRDAAVADWEENFAQVAERFAGYEDVSVGAEGEAERWPEFEAAQAAWGDAAEQLLASTPVGTPVPAEALASERALFGVARDMVDAIGGDIYEQIIPAATAEVGDKDSSLRLQLTIAVLACLVLGAIVLVIVGRGLRPLDSLVGSAQQIAEGDPDVTLSVKADQSEVGRLTDAFQRLTVYVQDVAGSLDKMAHGDLSTVPTTRGDRDALGQSMQTLSLSLREVVGRIRDAVGQLTGSSHQLVSMSEHLASSAADTSYQASAAAAAGQQMHASIREVAHNASEAVNVSARAVDLAGAASVVVSRLEQSSGEIGAVLEVISSIAAQTNLLALNATIEAARAGEAGRGFAVVADEVKHLATQTTDATEGVRARVAAIQADTAQAIVSISSVAEIISTISEHMHGIASAVEEQEATTNEIARSIEGVAGTADSTRSVTDAAGVTAAELERLAAHLDEVIGRFTGV